MDLRPEGIEADDEALAVLAQAGEGQRARFAFGAGSGDRLLRDKLEAAAVRALLGAFGIDAMAQVTTALAAQDGGAMLALVDELERNGGSPQHFSRELSRYLRNLLVAKIAGEATRLIAASSAERAAMKRSRRRFPKKISRGICSCRSICFAICSFRCSRGFIWRSGC